MFTPESDVCSQQVQLILETSHWSMCLSSVLSSGVTLRQVLGKQSSARWSKSAACCKTSSSRCKSIRSEDIFAVCMFLESEEIVSAFRLLNAICRAACFSIQKCKRTELKRSSVVMCAVWCAHRVNWLKMASRLDAFRLTFQRGAEAACSKWTSSSVILRQPLEIHGGRLMFCDSPGQATLH